MRSARCAVVILLALCLATTIAADSVRAQSGEVTVNGTVFWDRDGDGVLDAGEPPLNLSTQLIDASSGEIRNAAPNSPDGRFTMLAQPGTYRVEASLPAQAGICVDAFRGTRGPFSPSDCYGAPLPYYADAPAEPFELEAGEAVTTDVPVRVRDQMVFSLRAVEEDHYPDAGDTISAMVNGNECGTTTIPAAHPDTPIGENSFPLLVDGNGARDGCATQGDAVTFVLNGRTALNEPVTYERFDPENTLGQSLSHLHLRRVDLVFAEQWAWFYSDDVRAHDYGAIDGARIVALVNGVECGQSMSSIDVLYGVAGSPGVTFYGFGPVLIPSRTIGGCANSGDLVEFRVSGTDELVATAPWQAGVIALEDVVLHEPPRAIADPSPTLIRPPAAGAGPASARDGETPLAAPLVFGVVLTLFGTVLKLRARP